jgi:hypothetical protein
LREAAHGVLIDKIRLFESRKGNACALDLV